MRFGYCEAHSFRNEKLLKRLVLYCRDHLIDCLFISGDKDDSLRLKLGNLLLNDNVILFNKNGRIEINGIKCELKDAYLLVEGKEIMPLSGCLNSITVLEGKVKSQYICMELLLHMETEEMNDLEAKIDHQIDGLLKKVKGKKERKFN